MYLFDISEWKWYQICDDTASRGGPSLIFDHQMCIDIKKHIIYVFGGRILSATRYIHYLFYLSIFISHSINLFFFSVKEIHLNILVYMLTLFLKISGNYY